jgi:hypothetical protein
MRSEEELREMLKLLEVFRWENETAYGNGFIRALEWALELDEE